ncbi:MAG TPA: family 43 glycosylhydrolase [Kineosporiaceae bacterium]|jgi:arabinan endo-1,5-alpha-L-arabinosidase|nr:family 43 glycosylhydrolase [Kineosporiaceae bacterium]
MRVTGTVQRRTLARALPALALLVSGAAVVPAASAATTTTATAAQPAVLTTSVYRNPVSRSFADTYADPSVIRGKDGYWYAYATSDPLRSGGKDQRHYLPMSRSKDLVHWKYMGDAFTAATLPKYADTAHDASLWAPEIHYANGQWRLYYVVTETTVTAERYDVAIGMATAPSPLGPWTDSGTPVVAPRRVGPDNFLWTFDPDVVTAPDGSQHIYYGSYYGGIWHSDLDASGTKTVGDAVRVAVDNKFEGAYVTRKNGYWYLFASTANCCAGPTTGYSVHVGRSRSLTGPFLDKDGVDLNATGYSGGTPVLYQNGNRWIGTGHNTMATDDAGQDWILYHAIDRDHPYLDGTEGINRRPMLIDRLDWSKGWPLVRSGCGPSDTPQLGPVVDRSRAAASVRAKGVNAPDCRRDLAPGRPVFTDGFNGTSLAKGWTTVNTPAIFFSGGALNWVTEKSDLVGDKGNPGILLRNAPAGSWTAETKLTIDLGKDEVRNYQQGGLVAYVDDKLFTRLSTVAIWDTRQNEFGKEMPWPNADGFSYGGTIVGAPALTTWLRIVHRIDPQNREHELTAFTSRDGKTWTRGGTWTLPAGSKIRVGLVSQGAGYSDAAPATASFDYFRIYQP